MLITFTTDVGTLVIRSEDLRRIEDGKVGCLLGWIENDMIKYAPIQGTALENLDRIVAAEARLIAAYEEMQQRKDRGLPPLAIPRGKVGVR